MRNWTVWSWLMILLLAFYSCAGSEEQQLPTGGDDLQAGPVELDESAMYAVVQGDTLEVFFPLNNGGTKALNGEITLNCRHLTEEYKIAAESDFRLDKDSLNVVAVHLDDLPPYLSVGEQAQYVVDYSVKLSGVSGEIKGSRSLFMLIEKRDLLVLVPEKMFQGQKSAVRAFLSDPRTGTGLPGEEVVVTLTDEEGNVRESKASTDDQGVAVFELTQEEVGNLTLRAAVTEDSDEQAVETSVQVIRESKLYLTSDKPMYQPGQTMFLRALALDRFSHLPKGDEAVLFEVFDAKGNKVFKEEGTSNSFGVAAAQFVLGSQVLLGQYTLKVTVGDVQSEKAVTVDRYSLPKFSVDVRLNKTFYQAGQTVTGEVNAQYFFGKPVAGGTVEFTVYKYEAQWVPDVVIQGQTNADGFYAFEYAIPTYVVGQPLEGGKALLMAEIVVTDTAEHSQTVGKSLMIVQNPLDIVLIPESGTVVPEVANNFFLFVTDPLGNPVEANCVLTVNGAELDDEDDVVSMPAFGPAVVSLLPHAGQLAVSVSATDDEGSTASQSFNYSVGEGESAILLRTDKAIYQVGETVTLDAYVTGGYHHIFLDVLRKNQVVLTKTLSVEEGTAQLLLDLDQEMSEDLVFSAYMLADSGQIIRDSRVIYVRPASDLRIVVNTDKPEYIPGESATVSFAVTDAQNQPTQAALGVQVVDEAVFALSDMRPGLMELYFYLEDELQNPTYQVGAGLGFSFGQLFAESSEAEPGSEQEEGIQDTTQAAFAAMGEVALGQNKLSSWEDSLATMKQAVAPYYEAMKEDVRSRLEAALALRLVDYYDACGFLQTYLATPRYYDAWGSLIEVTASGDDWSCSIKMTSAGPDELMGTNDDASASLDLWALMGEYWKGGRDIGWGGGEWMGEDGDWNAPTAGVDEGAYQDAGSSEPEEGEGGEGDDSGIRVRSWFPETLFVAPSLITDESGLASVVIPLADSITEWRMTTLASSAQGQLGSRADGILVFQDFFVDIDFPKYLTQNDEISFPIAIYNYLETPQTVDVQVEAGDWFQFVGDDHQQVDLAAGQVKVVYFPVKVLTVGWHQLTVYGIGQESVGDAIRRTVEVKPDGKAFVVAESARFANDGENPSEDHVTQTVQFPENAIVGSQAIVVTVLPGLSSHIVQGMDSIFQLPGGCFEQTTSSAWPNVLALRYMQESGTITPDKELQAIEYVNVGYQRVLTFECASGGFNWWEGDDPGNAILSAVGIMMLTDTKSIYDTVDQNVIDRSADYLYSVQKSDGSWSEEQHLHAGNENLGASSLRGTCYITWGLAYGGYTSNSGFNSALNFIKSNVPSETDRYTRAMCANALAAAGDSSSVTSDILSAFHEEAVVEEENVHWSANGSTLVNSWGDGADVELTALVALAMNSKGSYPQDFQGAINWLVESKDPQGNWGYNTQATVLALKAFLAALTANPGFTQATVEVLFNGASVATREFDEFNKDVLWSVELTQGLDPQENVVELLYSGTGALSYQVVSTHYLPWNEAPVEPGPLTIDVSYDATHVAVDDIVTATVTITNNDQGLLGMVLVSLGIPPGFTLVTQDLAALKEAGTISMFEVTGKQIILYFDAISAGEPVVLSYSLVAEYPIKAQTGGSEVHMYYDSETNAEDASQEIEVTP